MQKLLYNNLIDCTPEGVPIMSYPFRKETDYSSLAKVFKINDDVFIDDKGFVDHFLIKDFGVEN